MHARGQFFDDDERRWEKKWGEDIIAKGRVVLILEALKKTGYTSTWGGRGGGSIGRPVYFRHNSSDWHDIQWRIQGGGFQGACVPPPPPSFRKFFFTKVKFCWQKLVLNEYKICLKVLEMALLDIQIFKSLSPLVEAPPPFPLQNPGSAPDIWYI